MLCRKSWPSAAPISTGAARWPARSCRARPTPARCARMSAAARSMRCAMLCGGAPPARCSRCAAAMRPATPWRGRSPQAGIADLSAVFLDRATPSYTALLDREGDVIAALADMALYELAFPKQMQAGEGPRGDRGRRRRALRRQPSCRRVAEAGGAGRRQAGLRHRDFAGQGGPALRRAAHPLLPVHEPPRGGRAGRHRTPTIRSATIVDGLRSAWPRNAA